MTLPEAVIQIDGQAAIAPPVPSNKPKQNVEESTPPAALMQYLKDFPQIKEIALHLDNDMAGGLAAKTIQNILPSAYAVSDEPPERGKDYNDYLKITLKMRQPRERE